MTDLPQLRMRHGLRALPPARPLPPGAALRLARAADALGIARVLSESFGESWSSAKVHEELLDHPEVPAVFVVEQRGDVVATASYQVQASPDLEAGWVHWVGVLPAAQGQALGETVTRRVLEEAMARRRTQAFLTTDDVRLAAIRTYVRLGFEPDPWHESHPERWRAALAAPSR